MQPDSSFQALAAWYSLNTHRFFWNVALTAALVLVIGSLMLRSGAENPEKHFHQSLAAAKELEPARIPDAENGVPLFFKAHAGWTKYAGPPLKSLGAYDDYSAAKPRSTPPEDFPGKLTVEELRGPDVSIHLAANAAGFKLLHDASRMKVYWGTDFSAGVTALLPYLAKMRHSARLLSLEARTFAANGDHASAAESIAACMRFADHAKADGLLITHLVSLAMRGLAFDAVERILLFSTPTTHQEIELYRKAIALRPDAWTEYAQCMEVEKRMMVLTLDQLGSRRLGMSALGLSNDVAFMPWYGSDRNTLLTYMNDLIHDAKQHRIIPDSKIMERLKRSSQGPAFLTGMLVPVMSGGIIRFVRTEEKHIALDTALAALQFRLKYARDITHVHELVPEFMKTAPKGVFHPEQPLLVRRDENGYLSGKSDRANYIKIPGHLRFYTVGENGIDNQGYGRDEHKRTEDAAISKADDDEAMIAVPPRIEQGVKK